MRLYLDAPVVYVVIRLFFLFFAREEIWEYQYIVSALNHLFSYAAVAICRVYLRLQRIGGLFSRFWETNVVGTNKS